MRLLRHGGPDPASRRSLKVLDSGFRRNDNFIGIFKECGADGWVTKYEKELATLGK